MGEQGLGQYTIVARLAAVSPGGPLLSVVAAGPGVWTAARVAANTLHIFLDAAVVSIVAFPEDVTHLSGGALQQRRACFVVVTALGRTWAVMPTAPRQDSATLPAVEFKDLWPQLAPTRGAHEAAYEHVGTFPAGSFRLSSETKVPIAASHADSLTGKLVPADSACAALLLPAPGTALINPAHSCLAMQAAWEYLAHAPPPPQDVEPACLFADLSHLHQLFAEERGAAESLAVQGTGALWGASQAGPSAMGPPRLAVTTVRWLLAAGTPRPGLAGATCALCLTRGGGGSTVGPGFGDARAAAGVRAALAPAAFDALLGLSDADSADPPCAALLVGTAAGEVWAHPLGTQSAAVLGPPTSREQDVTQPRLLFDLQQPLAALLALPLQDGGGPGLQAEGLILVGRCGRIAAIRGAVRAPAPTLLRAEDAGKAQLAATMWKVHTPITSACVTRSGALVFCAVGRVYAAAMHTVCGHRGPDQLAKQGGGSSMGNLRPQLQPTALSCSALGIAAVTAPLCAGSADVRDRSEGVPAAELWAMTLDGCLLALRLPSAAELQGATAMAALPEHVEEQMESVLAGLKGMAGCVAALEPNLAAADAQLAELAVSLPLALDARKGLIACRIARLSLPSGSSRPTMEVSLENGSAYPLTASWSLITLVESEGADAQSNEPGLVTMLWRAAGRSAAGGVVLRADDTMAEAGGGALAHGSHAVQVAVPLAGLLSGAREELAVELPGWSGRALSVRLLLCHASLSSDAAHAAYLPLLATRLDILDALQPGPVGPSAAAAAPHQPQGGGPQQVLRTRLQVRGHGPLPSAAHAFLVGLLQAGRCGPMQPSLPQAWRVSPHSGGPESKPGPAPAIAAMDAAAQRWGTPAAMVRDARLVGWARMGHAATFLSLAAARVPASSGMDPAVGFAPTGLGGCGSATLRVPPSTSAQQRSLAQHAVDSKQDTASESATYEIVITSSSLAAAAAAHAGILWRARALQCTALGCCEVLPPANLPAENLSDAALEGLLEEARGLQQAALSLQDAGGSLVQLRRIADAGEDRSLHGLALQALLARKEAIASGLVHTFRKTREITAQVPQLLAC